MKPSTAFVGMALSILTLSSTLAFAQKPAISQVEIVKCGTGSGNPGMGDYLIYQGETFEDCLVYGPGLITALGVNVSGSGVTAAITNRTAWAKKPGTLPQDKLQIRFTATSGAATGNRTVTINGPAWNGKFTIKIAPKAQVTSTEVPEPDISFNDNVDVLLKGQHLGNIATVGAGIVSAYDETGTQISNTAVSVTAALQNSVPHTDSQVMIRLNFSQQLSEANVKILLRGDPAKCGALRAFSNNPPPIYSQSYSQPAPFEYTVNIKAKPSGQNFVKTITFPYGSSIAVGSIATIQINLEKPVEPYTGPPFMSMDGTASSQGAHVLWKLIPADAFEQAAGGSPYNPNGLNTLIIPGGNEFGQITVQVKNCPSTRSQSSTVKIQTWRLNQSTNQPPHFKEQQFTINCPTK
jgi:hypothetical protein